MNFAVVGVESPALRMGWTEGIIYEKGKNEEDLL